MHSDNRTNFIGANRELTEALSSLSQEQITRELIKKAITWSFNLLLSLHMGGIFEATVMYMKRAMKTVINNQVLPEETFHTVLVKTEAILKLTFHCRQ